MLWRLLKSKPQNGNANRLAEQQVDPSALSLKKQMDISHGDVPGLLVRATAKCSSELLAAGDPKTRVKMHLDQITAW